MQSVRACAVETHSANFRVVLTTVPKQLTFAPHFDDRFHSQSRFCAQTNDAKNPAEKMSVVLRTLLSVSDNDPILYELGVPM